MKKVFVKKDDYDLYSIRLPVRFMFGRKRRNFVVRELEKIHPNYSVSKSVDDSRVSVRRRGVFADVAVMERERLSSYMRGASEGSRLYLEGAPKRAVFVSGGRSAKIAAFSALFLSAFAAVWLLSSRSGDSSAPVSGRAVADSSESGSTASAALLAPQELFAAVLASVRSKGGRVTNLSWLDGKCSFAISGCNSEDVAAANYCVVSYSSGKPQFNFAAKVNDRKMAAKAVVPVVVDSSGGIRSSFAKVDNVIPLLRECVFDSGSDVLSEKVSKDTSSISFVCEPDKLRRTLLSVSECARLSGWCETAVSVDCDGFFVSVSVSLKNLSGEISKFDNPLSVLGEYSDVFMDREKPKEMPLHGGRKTAPEDGNVSVSKSLLVADGGAAPPRVKIGEIRKGTRSFVYYRSQEGKVTSEVVDAN